MKLATGLRQLARGPWAWSLSDTIQQAIWVDEERGLVRYYRPTDGEPVSHVAEVRRRSAVAAIQEDADAHWENLWNGTVWILT